MRTLWTPFRLPPFPEAPETACESPPNQGCPDSPLRIRELRLAQGTTNGDPPKESEAGSEPDGIVPKTIWPLPRRLNGTQKGRMAGAIRHQGERLGIGPEGCSGSSAQMIQKSLAVRFRPVESVAIFTAAPAPDPSAS